MKVFSYVKIFLLLIACFLSFSLFQKWQLHQETAPLREEKSITDVSRETSSTLKNGARVELRTETLDVTLDEQGNPTEVKLLDYPSSIEENDPFSLITNTEERYYLLRSGIINSDNRPYYFVQETTSPTGYDRVFIHRSAGLEIIKKISFQDKDYTMEVTYTVKNTGETLWKGKQYFELARKIGPKKSQLSGSSFQGGAFHSSDTPFKKLPLEKAASRLPKGSENEGWIAMLERYFLTAILPKDYEFRYYSGKDKNDAHLLGVASNFVDLFPGEEKVFTNTVYMGPEKQELLAKIDPALKYTIDYGIFWPISAPLFWLLKQFHALTHNWGIAIILVTIMIKLLFFKLSSKSYRSMAAMRKIQPKIESLKNQFGEDKQKMGQELIALYQREKINPLGGCLPILVQIPVFIALYYVLLESVELRQAPFVLWIQDLSTKDPFYLLPIIMGGTMLLQQKMNPAPSDPLQAKVLMIMPIFFTFLFMGFPAGLVLYWVVNNTLSLVQQFVIVRMHTRK